MTTTLPTSPLGGAMPDRIQAAFEGHRQRLASRPVAAQAQGRQPGSRDAAIAKLRAAGYLDGQDDPTDAQIMAAVERVRADRDAGRARTAADDLYASLYSNASDPNANLTPEERALYSAIYPDSRNT